jgi:hypothetical protein
MERELLQYKNTYRPADEEERDSSDQRGLTNQRLQNNPHHSFELDMLKTMYCITLTDYSSEIF